MKQRTQRTLAAGTTALVAVGALAIGLRRDPIESDLETRANAALQAAGYGDVTASFEGRDGTLVGSINEDSVEAALDLVRQLEGVRVATAAPSLAATGSTTTTIAQPADTPAVTESGFAMTSDSGRISLFGILGDQVAVDTVTTAAGAAFPGATIDSQLEFAPNTTDSVTPDAIAAAMPLLAEIEGVVFDLDGGSASVSGVVADAAAANRITDALTATLSVPVEADFIIAEQPASEPESTDTQAAVTDYLDGRTIVFESGSADLSADGRELLDGLAELLATPGPNLAVEGHTDSDGDEDFNQTLSESRANAVVDYLVASGVDAARLSAQGFGETRPIAPNDTLDGRATNRRIEFNIEGS